MTVLYLANIDRIDTDLEKALLPLLPEERRQRVLRAHDLRVRRTRLAAGGLLLYAIERANVPRDALIERTEQGKPYLPGYPDLCFSLSHSGLWAACAVSDQPVGVDVQQIVPTSRKLWQRCLSAAELVWLEALPDHLRDAGFCRVWSMKEAWLKASGRGLEQWPRELALLDGQGRAVCRKFLFWEYPLSGYALTCCGLEEMEDEVRHIDLSCLLK